MALESKALNIFPNADEPHTVRPITARGAQAVLAGLSSISHDVEQSMTAAAQVMRLLTGEEEFRVGIADRDEFVRALAGSWLSRFGAYVPVETSAEGGA